MNELVAHEIPAHEIKPGDRIEHHTKPTLSGGRPRIVESTVLGVTEYTDDLGRYVEVQVAEDHVFDVDLNSSVVVYRRDV